MAKAWIEGRCPGCGKVVNDSGILISPVKVTARRCRGSHAPAVLAGKDPRRVNFKSRERGRIWHEECWNLPRQGTDV